MSHASVEAGSASDPVVILYTNWRKETAVRRLKPAGGVPFWWGKSDYHKGPDGEPLPQWFFLAADVDRPDDGPRDFAISGIKAWGQEAVDAALARSPAPAVPESVRRVLDDIAKEAGAANDVIRLNRDGGGQGRVRVATAMHRIERMAGRLLASDPPSGRAGEETAPAPASAGVVPEGGWVADEPTPEMYAAARDWSRGKYGMPIGNEAARGCWQAMLWHAPVDLCALVAAPEPAPAPAPAHGSAESEGWCFDMEAAPRDGTIVLLWRERWGEPSAAYWGLAPLAVSAEVATKLHPWVFLDSTSGLNGFEDSRDYGPTAWRPLPSPPATQPATPAEGR